MRRELAFQISEQFEALGAGIGVKCTVIVGGVDMMTQSLALAKKPHIVIGKPSIDVVYGNGHLAHMYVHMYACTLIVLCLGMKRVSLLSFSHSWSTRGPFGEHERF